MRFFDASAVVKGYINEPDSAAVRRLFAKGSVVVSRLSEVEVVSAFNRLMRERRITSEQRDRASQLFLADFAKWQAVEVTAGITSVAVRLLRHHSLRASDAVQLASALVVQSALGRPLLAFVAFDQRLADAARDEQLTVIPP